MTIPVGGLRARLIHDSIFHMLQDSLAALGWLNSDRTHLPVTVIDYPLDKSVEVPVNTVSMAESLVVPGTEEIGSNFMEFRWTFWVDVFAENPALGKHLSMDLFEVIRGGLPSIGRGFPTITFYDYTQATPPVFATGIIENPRWEKVPDYPGSKPWEKLWWMVRFDICDYYSNENG